MNWQAYIGFVCISVPAFLYISSSIRKWDDE